MSCDTLRAFLCVFIGGGTGSVCRYAIGAYLLKGTDGRFPWATLTPNTLGCLIIGALLALARHKDAGLAQLLLVTGFCGGFTTFSTFSADTLRLLREGQHAASLTYMSLSLAAGLACTAAGYALADRALT